MMGCNLMTRTNKTTTPDINQTNKMPMLHRIFNMSDLSGTPVLLELFNNFYSK